MTPEQEDRANFMKEVAKHLPPTSTPDAARMSILDAKDELVLMAADEIYYLDWRENDDDEKTAGWRHPGYFTEVNMAYDFAKLVAAGLMEQRDSEAPTPSYRITDKARKYLAASKRWDAVRAPTPDAAPVSFADLVRYNAEMQVANAHWETVDKLEAARAEVERMHKLVKIALEVFKAQVDPEHVAHGHINWQSLVDDFAAAQEGER